MAGHSLPEMRKSGPSDPELLGAWLEHQREPAFREIVARYAGLVQATALRSCGNETMAAEAAQLTFITLARKAKSLTSCKSLGGWLHQTAILHTKNLTRQGHRENNKRQLLSKAMEAQSQKADGDLWHEMQPVLDEALTTLSDKDREALLLRFYRSLSVREVAETLGITVHASQKRIDRAVEKLREKFTRRGIQLGTSLSGVMLAGFSADAQAASFPISSITAKAIAASPATAASLTTNLSLMKASTFVPPIAAIALIGAWIGFQRASISKTEEDTIAVQRQIDAADSKLMLAASQTPKPTTANTSGGGGSSIEWKEFVDRFAELRASGDQGPYDMIEKTLQSMTEEELVAELEVVRALDVPPMYREMLEGMVMTPLMLKAPQLALDRFMDQPSTDSDNWHGPADILKKWMSNDPDKAITWLDEQIAAGKFDSKSLNEKNQLRIQFERTVIEVLLKSNLQAATERVQNLPENQRGDVLSWLKVTPEDQAAFADLVRSQAPAAEQPRILSELALQSVASEGFDSATACLDRIKASPAEKSAVVEGVAITHFQNLLRMSGITRREVDALREWSNSISPDSTSALTGKALGLALNGGGQQTSYTELADLAVEYGRIDGSDDGLIEFLKDPLKYMKRTKEVLALAEKITDEERRKELLESLENVSQYYKKP